MILPDHEIRKALNEGRLVIEPLEDPEVQIQPAWVDLRLGSEFRIFKHTEEACIDAKDPKDYTELKEVKESIIIHPQEFLLGITKERIKLPDNMVAFVDGKSSIGRLGLTAHITAGWIDPCFDGRLVLEMSNLGKMPVRVYPNMRICKLVLIKMNSPAEVPYHLRKESKYRGQDSVIESKINQEMH
ncbi:MAG: dCTP deaminase [Candidatus Aenigmatarchaeota archaeon]